MWKIHEYDEVTSTNEIARQLILSDEASHGEVIQASHQTAGRGRIVGRVWQDEPGQSLLMSVVLTRVPAGGQSLQYFSALCVLEALRTIAEQHGLAASNLRLKWPNDIQLHGKKVCGILTEALWSGPTLRAAIVGIGVNVGQDRFDEELKDRATSLHQSGVMVSVTTVRDAILQSIEKQLARYAEDSAQGAQHAIVENLQRELEWMTKLGPRDMVVGEGAKLSNLKFEAVTETGSLVLRREDGTRITLHAGSVEWSEA